MSGTCCGRRAARVTTEVITQSLEDLEASIQDPGSGAGALERDPNCECDPCMCPSDDVPCNARYLGDDLSNQGLQQALDRLVRHARQVQAAQSDGCECADRPPYVEPEPQPTTVRPPPVTPSPDISPPRPRNGPDGNGPDGNGPDDNRPDDNRPTELPPPPQPQRRERETGFHDLPPELRYEIYRLYFEDLDQRQALHEIAAVRVRQGENAPDSRITRNLRRTSRRGRRHILDIHNYPEWRRRLWPANAEPWQREMAAITYEPSDSDNVLAQLPGQRLGLLAASPLVRYETVDLFYSQRFRFTHPREQNRIRVDADIHHGILAAEAFFANRPQWFLNQFSEIEIDLTAEPAERDSAPVVRPARSEVMLAPRDNRADIGNRNWTNGLNRLPYLANILERMPFQHLRLNFRGDAPSWREDGITVSGRIRVPNTGFPLSCRSASFTETPQDPRVAFEDINDNPEPQYPWTIGLFNIGRRRRLRLHHHFEYLRDPADTAEVNGRPYNRALYMLSTIRGYLLENAQLLGNNQYQGMHVTMWTMPEQGSQRHYRQVIIECDDEYDPGTNSIVSRYTRTDAQAPPATEPWSAPIRYTVGQPPPAPPPPVIDVLQGYDPPERSAILDQDSDSEDVGLQDGGRDR